MRVVTGAVSALYFVHTDHLGSVSLTTDGAGAVVSEQKFTAWGVVRAANGAMPTDVGYTGQRADASTGLMFYGARYYDSYLNRFISADSIVPGAGNPQALNRYSYVLGNPLKYTDPSGHCPGALAMTQCEGYYGIRSLGPFVKGGFAAAGAAALTVAATEAIGSNIDEARTNGAKGYGKAPDSQTRGKVDPKPVPAPPPPQQSAPLEPPYDRNSPSHGPNPVPEGPYSAKGKAAWVITLGYVAAQVYCYLNDCELTSPEETIRKFPTKERRSRNADLETNCGAAQCLGPGIVPTTEPIIVPTATGTPMLYDSPIPVPVPTP
ncbi:MAG: RHS repeat-associated core domain-containing protein [Chloroflexi bacterium]|nr:RHS repeat-associated core domain-containing protein [Chloroflexota bacterium]